PRRRLSLRQQKHRRNACPADVGDDAQRPLGRHRRPVVLSESVPQEDAGAASGGARPRRDVRALPGRPDRRPHARACTTALENITVQLRRTSDMAFNLTREEKVLGQENFQRVADTLTRRDFMKSLVATGGIVVPVSAAAYFKYADSWNPTSDNAPK